MAGFPFDFLIFFLTGSFVGDPAVCCAPPASLDDAVGKPSSIALRFSGYTAPPLGPAELFWATGLAVYFSWLVRWLEQMNGEQSRTATTQGARSRWKWATCTTSGAAGKWT